MIKSIPKRVAQNGMFQYKDVVKFSNLKAYFFIIVLCNINTYPRKKIYFLLREKF